MRTLKNSSNNAVEKLPIKFANECKITAVALRYYHFINMPGAKNVEGITFI